MILCVCSVSAIPAAPSPAESPPRSRHRRPRNPSAGSGNGRNPIAQAQQGQARLRPHQLELVPAALDDLRAGLGADAVQSSPGVAGSCLVSTATRKPRACNPRSGPRSSWSRLAAGDHRETVLGTLAPSSLRHAPQAKSASTNLPPPSPSVPTKSVSQKLHWAVARSCSRPDHKLQPAKRRNTARLPLCTPSPWSVRKHSLTA